MQKTKEQQNGNVHPWRHCPYGEHWVITHPMNVPPSETIPEEHITTRHGHCAKNPSGKDQLYPNEITEIANQYFFNLKDMPCPLSLNFKDGGKYDNLIAGWVQYWNDVLKPSTPLDANLIKALIATESSFNPERLADENKPNSARGLMQITNSTREILGDDEGELKDHFVNVTREELNDPGTNICAGIRWLFQKRAIASSRLKHPATWIDAVYEYKGLTTASKERAQELINRFKEKYEELQKCGKP